MIFRRPPPYKYTPLQPQAAAYKCLSCDVLGRGTECWCCGATDLTPIPSLWVGSRGIPIS